jgi:hypothetical protein
MALGIGSRSCRLPYGHINGNDLEPTVTQSSALYFKRYKNSKGRAALFRQLRASSKDRTRNARQQTFGSAYIGQELPSGQRLLRGFAS